MLKVNSDEVDKGAWHWRLHSWLETIRKALRGPKRRYTVPNTLNLKQRTLGVKYAPLEVQKAALESQDQQVCEPREEQKS